MRSTGGVLSKALERARREEGTLRGKCKGDKEEDEAPAIAKNFHIGQTTSICESALDAATHDDEDDDARSLFLLSTVAWETDSGEESNCHFACS
jgi:hypothetical protein